LNKEKYFFDKEYRKRKSIEFRFDVEILEDILKYKKRGKVFDIGCGDSGIGILLSEKGFNVTCVDISQRIIEEIKKESKKRNVGIKAICEDIEEMNISDNYDIIIITGILHLLDRNKVFKLLANLKKHTNKKGIHVIDVFLKGSFCENYSKGYFFEKGELHKHYSDWKVLEYEIYEDTERNKNEYSVLIKN
jgi:2-polyprenyl-3-methyl-5-hydroxy-6-metoxy-1,4-benzoquinol methylase